jgi:hypothetical protein
LQSNISNYFGFFGAQPKVIFILLHPSSGEQKSVIRISPGSD